MASTQKTANLQLNMWSGTDKPTRSDFVMDNQLIDDAITTHGADTQKHLTSEEKTRVSDPYYVDVVQGTGTNPRTIPLDFTPKMVIYFAADKPPIELSGGITTLNSCIAVNGMGGSGTCEIGTQSFSVYHGTVGNVCYDLNNTSKQYILVAFR